MAQRILSINGRRRRTVTKQQREAEKKTEIEKLTFQISELRGKLTEVNEQRDEIELPNLEGRDETGYKMPQPLCMLSVSSKLLIFYRTVTEVMCGLTPSYQYKKPSTSTTSPASSFLTA